MTNIQKILLPLAKAISELAGNNITGVIYFYKKGECSCCYGSTADFQISGNSADNWASDREDFKLTFKRDIDEAKQIIKVIRKYLRGTGYKITWKTQDINTAMFISKR